MFIQVISLVALALGLAIASPAQESPENPGSSAPEFYHGIPACDFADRFCVWGQLFEAVGPNKERLKPMQKGPIDVCYQWDSTCSAPYQTVCKLHGPHGFQGREGSYFFSLPVDRGWRIKPRVTYPHLSWKPTHKIVSARSIAPGTRTVMNFTLLGAAASTGLCDQ